MKVFLSYGAADRKLAEKLRQGLREKGLDVWQDTDPPSSMGADWQRRVEAAILAAEVVLVLVGPKNDPDEAQRLTWQMALEQVWKDEGKKLIPILVQDAKLPPFVLSSTTHRSVRAVRIQQPDRVEIAIDEVVALIQLRTALCPEDDLPPPLLKAALGLPLVREDRSERRQRFAELRRMAESLKP